MEKRLLLLFCYIAAFVAAQEQEYEDQEEDVPSSPSAVLPQFKYVLLCPAIIQPSRNFTFNLLLIQDDSHKLPVSFTAVLKKNGRNLTSQTFTQTQWGRVEHNFTNIKKLTEPISSADSKSLSVKITNATFFSNSIPDTYQTVLRDIFPVIQLDKTFYKASETVRFRIFIVNNDLMKLKKTILTNVTIEDSNKKLRWQRNGVLLNGTIFTSSYSLGVKVTTGRWKVILRSGDFASPEEKVFIVQDDHVLPEFSVKLGFNSPGYWVFNENEDYQGYVVASYFSGEPVKGQAVVTLKTTDSCNIKYDDGRSGKLLRTSSITLTGSQDDGLFTMPGLNEIIVEQSGRFWLSYCLLTFSVKVTATKNETIIADDATVLLYRDRYSIKMHKASDKVMIPGRPLRMIFQVTTPDQRMAVGNLKVVQRIAIETAKSVDYNYCNRNLEPRWVNQTSNKTADSNGMFEFIINAAKLQNAKSVIFYAYLADYPTISSCTIRSLPERTITVGIRRTISVLTVGQRVTFEIETTFAASDVYLILTKNGEPFYYDRVTAIRNTEFSSVFVKDLDLPPTAAPRCAAIVWTVDETNGEILADSIDLIVAVQQKVTATFENPKLHKGEATTLIVKTTEPKSRVALVAIDKAASMMAPGTVMTLKDVIAKISYYEPSLISTCDSANAVFSNHGIAISSNYRTNKICARGTGESSLDDAFHEDSNARPETLFWDDAVTDENGTASWEIRVPDVATTWVLTALAIGDEMGFGAVTDPVELSVANLIGDLLVPEQSSAVSSSSGLQVKARIVSYSDVKTRTVVTFNVTDDCKTSTDGWKFENSETNVNLMVNAKDELSLNFWIKCDGAYVNSASVTLIVSANNMDDIVHKQIKFISN